MAQIQLHKLRVLGKGAGVLGEGGGGGRRRQAGRRRERCCSEPCAKSREAIPTSWLNSLLSKFSTSNSGSTVKHSRGNWLCGRGECLAVYKHQTNKPFTNWQARTVASLLWLTNSDSNPGTGANSCAENAVS